MTGNTAGKPSCGTAIAIALHPQAAPGGCTAGRKYVGEYTAGKPTCGTMFELEEETIEPAQGTLKGAVALGSGKHALEGMAAPILPVLQLAQPNKVTPRCCLRLSRHQIAGRHRSAVLTGLGDGISCPHRGARTWRRWLQEWSAQPLTRPSCMLHTRYQLVAPT